MTRFCVFGRHLLIRVRMGSVRRWEQTPRVEPLSLIGQGQGKPEGIRDSGIPGVLALFALLQDTGPRAA